MNMIVHNGIKLAYDEKGEGNPAFVFVHGWTCDRSFFAPQAAHFSRRHRVVSVDLRGHGESDKPKGPYPIDAYADDIAHIIDHLDLGKAVVAGHSMGAFIALQLAASYPDLVKAIVLVDPAPFDFPPELRGMLESMVTAIEAGNQEPREQAIRNNMFLPASDPKLVEEVVAVMMAAPDHIAASAMRANLEFVGKEVAAKCKAPTLHLMSTFPDNPPHLMSQWLPNAVHGWTVGSGHFCQLEVPDQINAMIDSFLHHHL